MDVLAVEQLPVTATEIASWAIAIVAVLVVLVGGIVLLVSRRRAASRARDAAAGDVAPAARAEADGDSDA